MPSLREQLETCFAGEVCLMGIGNLEYGDDGFGPCLATALLANGMPGLLPQPELVALETSATPGGPAVVVAGTCPERYLGQIADQGFDNLVFLDAVAFGGQPGSVIFLDAEQLIPRFPQISTHKISLSVLAKWAEANGKTKAWLLGVEPESTRPNRRLTPAVQKTLEALTELLCDTQQSAHSNQQSAQAPVLAECRTLIADCSNQQQSALNPQQTAKATPGSPVLAECQMLIAECSVMEGEA